MKTVVQGSLITTFRCNAKCNMCNIWQHQTKPEEEIDYHYYEKLPAGLRINITGGESTIRKDIDDIFRILYPKASLLELSTNGYNTETIVALANKYPNILIRVSLEGLPKLNDSKRGTVNGFDHALRTMLELKKTRCKNIGFSVVISPDNYKDLIYLYDLCVALDVELGNSVVHNSWYFHKEDNNLTSDKALHEHENRQDAFDIQAPGIQEQTERLRPCLFQSQHPSPAARRRTRLQTPLRRIERLFLHRPLGKCLALQRFFGRVDHRQYQG